MYCHQINDWGIIDIVNQPKNHAFVNGIESKKSVIR
jgi:hypothetical protein